MDTFDLLNEARKNIALSEDFILSAYQKNCIECDTPNIGNNALLEILLDMRKRTRELSDQLARITR